MWAKFRNNSILISIFLLSVSFLTQVTAQPVEGVIIYEDTRYWTRIYSRLDYLTQEEKDRMKLVWGANDSYKQEMKVTFNPSRSIYTYLNDQGRSDDGRYTWKLPTYVATRDFEKGKQQDWLVMLGRNYMVDDSLQAPRWKVMNKIKDIKGYVCMMAVTEDTVRNQKITAWFADGIPASVGPGDYFGLPGAILELEVNDGDIVVTAKEIQLRPLAPAEIQIPKQKKAKTVSVAERNRLIWTHLRDNIKAGRYPYAAVPFL